MGYPARVRSEPDGYCAAWRERWRRERRADAAAARRARATARRIARLIVQRYGARRVVLCGSLARGDFRQGSDIDLAVAGVRKGRFFEASAAAARAGGEFEVDLVPLEAATGRYREWVRREGIVLYSFPASAAGPGRVARHSRGSPPHIRGTGSSGRRARCRAPVRRHM
jgi:predicted nucleotidyltransferase